MDADLDDDVHVDIPVDVVRPGEDPVVDCLLRLNVCRILIRGIILLVRVVVISATEPNLVADHYSPPDTAALTTRTIGTVRTALRCIRCAVTALAAFIARFAITVPAAYAPYFRASIWTAKITARTGQTALAADIAGVHAGAIVAAAVV